MAEHPAISVLSDLESAQVAQERTRDGGFLVRASFLLIALTAGAKLLGFARDQAIAIIFGAGPVADAYYIALTFVIALLSVIGGTLSTAVVPVLTGLWQRQRATGWWTTWVVGRVYAGGVLGVTVGIVLAAPWLVAYILGPGLPASSRSLAIWMVRALTVGFPFWASVSLLAGILNSRRLFVVPACGPIVLNGAMVLVVVFAGRRFGVPALAAGTVLGMVVQFCLLAPFVIRAWAGERGVANTDRDAPRRVWAMVGPLFGLSLLGQAPGIVDRAVASGLTVGSVAILSFAQKLMQLPLGLFVGGVATVFYTSLSNAWAREDPRAAADELALAIGMTLLLAVPAAVGLAVLKQPIVQVLFQHGRFDAAATALTSHTLLNYCIGLPVVAINLVLVRNAFASGDTTSPLKGFGAALITNGLGDWVLSRVMGPPGIALASSVGAIALALMLVTSWESGFRKAVVRPLMASSGVVLVSSGIMGAVVLVVSAQLIQRSVWLRLALPGALGLVVYVLLLLWFGPREVRLLLAKVRPSSRA